MTWMIAFANEYTSTLGNLYSETLREKLILGKTFMVRNDLIKEEKVEVYAVFTDQSVFYIRMGAIIVDEEVEKAAKAEIVPELSYTSDRA